MPAWTQATRETEAKGSLELRCLRLGGQYSKTREKREGDLQTHTAGEMTQAKTQQPEFSPWIPQ